MEDPIQEIVASLKISRRRRAAIARELHAHLEEARHDLELGGLPAEEAGREALARLGDAHEIADGFRRVYRCPRRSRVLLAFVLASAMGLGVFGVNASLASARPIHHAHVAHAKVSRTIR